MHSKSFSGLLAFLIVSSLASAQIKSDFNFGKGLKFESEDGNFDVTLKSRFQTLYTASSDLDGDPFDDVSSGVLVRRSRLKFDGHATPRLKFKMEFGLSNRDFSSPITESGKTANMILDAVLKYDLGHNMELWFGQTKLPGNRERVISSQTLQLVDRSLLNKYFTLDRDIGVQLRHSFNLSEKFVVKETVSIAQGEGRNITAGNAGGYDYTVRAEFFPFGEFSKKGAYTASAINYVKGQSNDDDGKLAIGVTFDFNNGTTRSAGQLGSFILDDSSEYVNADMSTLFIDAMYKYKRFSYMGAYASKTSEAYDDAYTEMFYTGWSYNNQVGCMLTSKSEISVRHTHVDGNLSGIRDMFTFGFSRYVSKHNLKFQTDFSITQQEGKDPQAMFRFQTEVAF